MANILLENTGLSTCCLKIRFESVKEELVGRKNELEVIQYMKEGSHWSVDNNSKQYRY